MYPRWPWQAKFKNSWIFHLQVPRHVFWCLCKSSLLLLLTWIDFKKKQLKKKKKVMAVLNYVQEHNTSLRLLVCAAGENKTKQNKTKKTTKKKKKEKKRKKEKIKYLLVEFCHFSFKFPITLEIVMRKSHISVFKHCMKK